MTFSSSQIPSIPVSDIFYIRDFSIAMEWKETEPVYEKVQLAKALLTDARKKEVVKLHPNSSKWHRTVKCPGELHHENKKLNDSNSNSSFKLTEQT